MNKLTYNTPVVDITVWEKSDVITTSGMNVVSNNTIPEIGDSNTTASVDFSTIFGA
ncbi:MAG: hypothetical protein IKL73_04470 [Lachnospiraceae bacterium]|nr:hypothetical protein [Lachnospiraceae bacterium]MBR6697513.1 hypothetical protein [Lachnospiraceae bacterium]